LFLFLRLNYFYRISFRPWQKSLFNKNIFFSCSLKRWKLRQKNSLGQKCLFLGPWTFFDFIPIWQPKTNFLLLFWPIFFAKKVQVNSRRYVTNCSCWSSFFCNKTFIFIQTSSHQEHSTLSLSLFLSLSFTSIHKLSFSLSTSYKHKINTHLGHFLFQQPPVTNVYSMKNKGDVGLSYFINPTCQIYKEFKLGLHESKIQSNDNPRGQTIKAIKIGNPQWWLL